jgi:hypothetical protein
VRLEDLGTSKIVNNLIGTRTRDLPSCSIVLQPSTLPRASYIIFNPYLCWIWYRPMYIVIVCGLDLRGKTTRFPAKAWNMFLLQRVQIAIGPHVRKHIDRDMNLAGHDHSLLCTVYVK